MEADYIILSDGILPSKSKKVLDGGVAVKGSQIVCVGTKEEVAPYLGVDTEVLQFENTVLFTFHTADDEKAEAQNQSRNPREDAKEKKTAWANIAVFAGGSKRSLAQIKKMVNLRLLMYQGELVFCKEN